MSESEDGPVRSTGVTRVTAYRDKDGKIHEKEEDAERANQYLVYIEFDNIVYGNGSDLVSSFLAKMLQEKLTSEKKIREFLELSLLNEVE